MIFDVANTALSVLVVGALLSLAFLLPERDGVIQASSASTQKFLYWSSGLWIVASLGNLLAILADIFESSLFEVLDLTIIRSFTTQVTLGKLLAYQVLVSIFVFISNAVAMHAAIECGTLWYCCNPHRLFLLNTNMCAQGNRHHAAAHVHRSVSYTHLTLPTKRIV